MTSKWGAVIVMVPITAGTLTGCTARPTGGATAVEFNGVRVEVPSSWVVRSIDQEDCDPGHPAIYVGDRHQPPQRCLPSRRVADAAYVTSAFNPSGFSGSDYPSRRNVSGQPVLSTGLSHTTPTSASVTVPWLNFRLDITVRDRKVASRIAKSVTPITRLGRGQPTGVNSAIDPAATNAHVFYARPVQEEATYEIGADVVVPGDAQRLASELARLSRRLTPAEGCAFDIPGAVVTLTYVSRAPPTTSVAVDMGPCGQVTAGDGTAWSLTPELRAHILDLVRKRPLGA